MDNEADAAIAIDTPLNESLPKLDVEWQKIFVEEMKRTGCVKKACEAARISRGYAFAERKKSAVFAEHWDDALEDDTDSLVTAAIDRAKKKSDLLLMFSIKAMRPDMFRENYDGAAVERASQLRLTRKEPLPGEGGHIRDKRHRATPWKRAFLKVLSETGVTCTACKAAKVARNTVMLHYRNDPEFQEQYDDAIDDACDMLIEVAKERAKTKSDLLMIFLLNGMRPDVYREKFNPDKAAANVKRAMA